MDDFLRNGSGYVDPTPYQAIKNLEQSNYNYKAKKLIKTLQAVSHLAGFEILGRIEIRDKETGEVYK